MNSGAYKDFKTESDHVRFEHPEEGDKTERKYRRYKLKSVEELEAEAGSGGQLDRTKKKAESIYRPNP
jgi:hypothetical protein